MAFGTCSNFGERKPCSCWRVFRAHHKALEERGVAQAHSPGGVRLVGHFLVTLVHSDILLQFFISQPFSEAPSKGQMLEVEQNEVL